MTSSVRNLIEEAIPYQPEPPRPLRRELPEPEPFPIEALGPLLEPAARGIHQIVQAPMAVCVQSCLAAANLAVQHLANVLLPFGQPRPLSEFFVTVAQSGDRKTSADALALTPIIQFEEKLRAEHRFDDARYRNDLDIWNASRKRILGDKEIDRAGQSSALDNLGPQPTPPLEPLLTCPEPTFEGLARLFADGRPSLGLFSSEGGQFLGGFGMSEEHRLKTSAALSQLWDGQALRRVRAGEGSRVLPNRRLCLHLMVQPEVSSQLLADSKLKDQGLLSRILPSAPTSLMGTRVWQEIASESSDAIDTYSHSLLAILEGPVPLKQGTTNELAPPAIDLSPRSKNVWVSFANHVERRLGDDGELATVRFFAAKAAEHAARLAGVLALTNHPFAVTVPEWALDAAIAITEYYISEWQRLVDSSQARPEILEAEKLLVWLQTRGSAVIGLPEIYQRGPNSIRDARAARQAVSILVEHGWLVPIEGGTVVDGVPRREAWTVVTV